MIKTCNNQEKQPREVGDIEESLCGLGNVFSIHGKP